MVFLEFFRSLGAMWRDPLRQGLVVAALLLMAGGTVFYRFVEDLSWVDSWYFTVITLTTVGYGDIAPTTTAGKVFTSLYVLVGVGLILALLNAVVGTAAERRRKTLETDDEQT